MPAEAGGSLGTDRRAVDARNRSAPLGHLLSWWEPSDLEKSPLQRMYAIRSRPRVGRALFGESVSSDCHAECGDRRESSI